MARRPLTDLLWPLHLRQGPTPLPETRLDKDNYHKEKIRSGPSSLRWGPINTLVSVMKSCPDHCLQGNYLSNKVWSLKYGPARAIVLSHCQARTFSLRLGSTSIIISEINSLGQGAEGPMHLALVLTMTNISESHFLRDEVRSWPWCLRKTPS